MKFLLIIFSCLILNFPLLVFANDCIDILNKDILDDCLSKNLDINDSKLFVAYENLREKIPDEKKKYLENSQKYWKDFTEYDCNVEASGLDSSAYLTQYLSCMVDSSVQRLERINYLLMLYPDVTEE